MPKPVEQMTVEEITKEISYIERQISAGKVGTPNVYVRLQALKDELSKRPTPTELVGRGFRGVFLTVDEIREVLEAQLERTATDEEVIAFIEYLEIDHGQWLNDNAKTFVKDKLPLPAKELPTIKRGKKKYYFDARLKQLRNVDNPHDFTDLSPEETEKLQAKITAKEEDIKQKAANFISRRLARGEK